MKRKRKNPACGRCATDAEELSRCHLLLQMYQDRDRHWQAFHKRIHKTVGLPPFGKDGLDWTDEELFAWLKTAKRVWDRKKN